MSPLHWYEKAARSLVWVGGCRSLISYQPSSPTLPPLGKRVRASQPSVVADGLQVSGPCTGFVVLAVLTQTMLPQASKRCKGVPL